MTPGRVAWLLLYVPQVPTAPVGIDGPGTVLYGVAMRQVGHGVSARSDDAGAGAGAGSSRDGSCEVG